MHIMKRRSDWRFVQSCPKRSSNDDAVVSGLSVTPSDISRLSAQGIAVNTANASMFSFDANPSSSLQPEEKRDSDRNSMWELATRSRQKLLKVRRAV